MVVLDAATAAIFKTTIQDFQGDIHEHLHVDAFAVWVQRRPSGWDAGIDPEAWVQIGAGTGKLYEHGAGGPTTSEGIIFPDSPYRFRTLASAALEEGQYLVLNGARLFRIDAFKIEDIEDLLANAYVKELFGSELPGVTP